MSSPSRLAKTLANLPPDQEVLVALDCETTGLDPARDHIIEIGAVKYRGSEELGRFSSLVNPQRELSSFITSLTGITQTEVDSAPGWDSVASGLREFIANHTLVGHSVGFDASFLRSHGVIPQAGVYDTFDLASVVLPEGPEYSLERLSARFGLVHDNPHRALSDALATRDLFLILLDRLQRLDHGILTQLQRLGNASQWPLGILAGRVLNAIPPVKRRSTTGPLGVDTVALSKRLRARRPSRADRPDEPMARDEFLKLVQSVFGADGELQKKLPGYEPRQEQEDMAMAVGAAIADGEHLAVEAGTGVGKSIAYLVSAALHAVNGGGPVVVSTNTINLQEQLVHKDIRVVRSVLEGLGVTADGLAIAQLKGRSNYLCFKRWAHSVQSAEPAESDARVMAKCLVWLQETDTGDRSELALGRDTPAFSRLSSQGAAGCPAQDGPCFLRKARQEALAADIVIVNHSLLLSDIAMGGGLLPPHEALIIDEAHHLEAVATRHLGFQVLQPQLIADLEGLSGERGAIADLVRAVQSNAAQTQALDPVPAAASGAMEAAARATAHAGEFYNVLRIVVASLMQNHAAFTEVRITDGIRAQPGWADLEIAWENLDGAMADVINGLRTLFLLGERGAKDDDSDAVFLNVSAAMESLEGARSGLTQAVSEPSPEMVYWLGVRPGDRGISINGAPLNVGPLLKEHLFEQERSVVLTGATLGYEKKFDRFRRNVGMEGGSDLMLGSPFDYRGNALIAVPEDMPEPGAEGYAKAVNRAIAQVARSVLDRVLVLFTSNSALESARRALSPVLEAEGIRVIGQGADGSPHRVMRTLAEEKVAVALGTSSLWEGVDLEGASLKALIMARLPFPVPTDPVFSARSELYEDGFGEYAIPEAVQRFRQGFGRLIRSRSDRGSFVILDRRILSKSYGVRFQRSLPGCTVRRVSLDELGTVVGQWNVGDPV
ncbi:MAG: helicase C-terminal domain-containing protein [Dehalococcoidia bacterium]